MEQDQFYANLVFLKEGSFVDLEWDRGNGKRKIPVRFDGFAENTPLLYTRGGTLLDIEKIGSYDSVISVKLLESIV